ncbi:MAG: SAM-dependent methyltransferase [Burkholderiales bacterium]
MRTQQRVANRRSITAALVAACVSLIASAQPLPESKDLDTPYVPTPQKVVDAMLAMGKVGPADFLIDLGSGDGRLVITAAKQLGARGFGVEIDPRLVKLANQSSRQQGVGERARFMEQDLFKTPLHEASVITMYLLPDVNIELRPRLYALKPGTRIVSHDYHLGDWRADDHAVLDVPDKPVGPLLKSDIYLWIVPAQVAGNWEGVMPGAHRSVRLALTQKYQEVEAKVLLGGVPLRVTRATLRGRALEIDAETSQREPVRIKLASDGAALAGSVVAGGGPVKVVLNR